MITGCVFSVLYREGVKDTKDEKSHVSPRARLAKADLSVISNVSNVSTTESATVSLNSPYVTVIIASLPIAFALNVRPSASIISGADEVTVTSEAVSGKVEFLNN